MEHNLSLLITSNFRGNSLNYQVNLFEALQIRHTAERRVFIMAENKQDKRTRNWAMIVYPESAPEDWREILDDLHIPWIASPLHDKDVNPDGTKKKPHWHVILTFENKKSFHQIKAIADKLNAPIPQACESLRGYVRYLVHTDNPEKYQYSKADIENHGVADIEKYFQNTASIRTILKALTRHICDEEVTNYADLIEYAMAKGDDWFDVASSHTIYFGALLKSEWQKQQNQVLKQGRNTFSGEAEKLTKLEKARSMAKMGVKQAVIADTLGISIRTVKRYLNGK